MRLLCRRTDAVIPQHVSVVLRCHDSEVVFSTWLLYICHGHESGFFGIVVDGSQWTIYKRLWSECSRLACHSGKIHCTLSRLSTLALELLRGLGLSLPRLIGNYMF